MKAKSRGGLVSTNAHFKHMAKLLKTETNNSDGAQISTNELRALKGAAILVGMKRHFEG